MTAFLSTKAWYTRDLFSNWQSEMKNMKVYIFQAISGRYANKSYYFLVGLECIPSIHCFEEFPLSVLPDF